jgi:hypothetical protein
MASQSTPALNPIETVTGIGGRPPSMSRFQGQASAPVRTNRQLGTHWRLAGVFAFLSAAIRP